MSETDGDGVVDVNGVPVPKEYKLRPIEELQAYENNPVVHPERQKDEVRRAIEKYGFMTPILCKEKTGEIADGHLRLEVANDLGMDRVPWTSVDHLTDKEIKGFRIAIQKTAYDGEFKYDLLAEEFQDLLHSKNFDIEDTAFTMDEIEAVMNEPDVDSFFEEGEEDEKGEGSGTDTVICPNCGEEIET